MEEKCAWCGKIHEVYAWKESFDEETQEDCWLPICRDCYDYVTGKEI